MQPSGDENNPVGDQVPTEKSGSEKVGEHLLLLLFISLTHHHVRKDSSTTHEDGSELIAHGEQRSLTLWPSQSACTQLQLVRPPIERRIFVVWFVIWCGLKLKLDSQTKQPQPLACPLSNSSDRILVHPLLLSTKTPKPPGLL